MKVDFQVREIQFWIEREAVLNLIVVLSLKKSVIWLSSCEVKV